jgi:hypothetical protein
LYRGERIGKAGVAPQLTACHYPKFSLGHGNI